MTIRRQAGWAIAALAVAISLVSGPAFAGRHDDRWRRQERWRDHHDYVAPPVVYAPAPVVTAPALSFSVHIR